MPPPCSGGSTSGGYALTHNRATPFSAIYANKTLCANVKPYTTGAPLTAVNFVAPNLRNDMHACSIATGDNWLKARVPRMIAPSATVVVTFGEGSSGTNGGGNV